ncbi:ribosome maturation factor RimM [Microvirga brassicacearum]|uniref:Ribosome maturation factor RimM n=1 Tax=Microvirga brassicacearum TaxID=2580413 RepID=A0A5N3P5X0_9HYPH|nr:ribosome maturation factor RimM [Microvirga brassicacearum]
MGRGRGGGAGATFDKGAPTPPPPTPPHKGEESPVAAAGSDLVLVGEFGRAHGLKGEVRLKSHTGDPLAIATYGPLLDAGGRSYILKNPRQAPGGAPEMLVVRVEGVISRDAAEALNRIELYLPREKLPRAEDEDEFLLADLIGLSVRDEAGAIIGTIVDVPNFGGGDLLEIAPATGGATAFLPFTKAFVPVVRLAERLVVAAPPDDLFAPARPEPDEAPA